MGKVGYTCEKIIVLRQFLSQCYLVLILVVLEFVESDQQQGRQLVGSSRLTLRGIVAKTKVYILHKIL